jgi:hypothetical protein
MYRNITTGAIRMGKYKLLVGGSFSSGVDPSVGEWAASWYGLFSPNATFNGTDTYACPPSSPCVFDLEEDPTEHVDLSTTLPAVTAKLTKAFKDLDATYHPPRVGPPPEPAAMCAGATIGPDGKYYITPWK